MKRFAVAAAVAGALLALPAAVGAASATSSNMLVGAVEFRLSLSRADVPAGHVGIQLVDKGMDPHNLALRRIDAHGHLVGPQFALPKVQSGALTSRTVTLTPGRWKVWCTLPGHDAQGMHARLLVRHAR